MLRDVLAYVRSLWSHWAKLLTSGLFAALVVIWELTGNTLWPKLGIAIIVITFLHASFSAWTEQREIGKRVSETLDASPIKEYLLMPGMPKPPGVPTEPGLRSCVHCVTQFDAGYVPTLVGPGGVSYRCPNCEKYTG